MTSATVSRSVVHPIRRSRIARSRWLLRAEWTKLWSVRSTAWSLGILVIAAIGIDTALTAATIGSWQSVSAASKSIYLADPTGFLGAVLAFAGIPICVLGVMVISSEYSTGMIQASILAVPRRTPMLAAKAAMFAIVTFVIGELVGFSSFFIGQAIIHSHVPVSLYDPGVLRAVFGVGLYLTVLGLLGLAIGALVRHTGAALTVVIVFVIVLSNLARALPGNLGTHVAAYMPSNAGVLITHAHQEAADLLSPWQGFGVLCLWAALLFCAAFYLLNRRDA
jgi:ABC-2 type transport system permease protein